MRSRRGSPRLSSTRRASCSRVNTRSGPSAVTRSRSGMRRPSSGCPCHGVAQHAGSDRVPLGMVGIQQAFWRCPAGHLGQLPSQIHRILHTGVEALPADRGMHVRRVAGQQHPSVPVGRRLPGHIGEPGNPGGTVHPVIRPVDGDGAPGSSPISTSAIRELVDGSHPGNSIPAALRIRLRPRSHPAGYSARSGWPSGSSTRGSPPPPRFTSAPEPPPWR